MFDWFALLGYVLLLWSFFEKKLWMFLYKELLLRDKFILIRNMFGLLVVVRNLASMYVLFLFIAYWLDNIWQSIGVLLFIFFVPLFLLYNVEETKQNS